MTDEEWEDLRRRCKAGEPLTMSCGQPGKPRVSKNGLKHFYHHAKANCSLHPGGESADHLEMKSLVAAAAREAGWDAIIEQPAHDRSWIADVMVSKGGEKRALEIQFSRQDADEFRRRQQRYEADGVQCLWLAAEVNREAAEVVPSVMIGGAPGARTLTLPDAFSGPVATDAVEAIHLLLNDRIKLFIEPVVRAYSLDTAMLKCWREGCNRWITAWRLEDLQLETRCGRTGTLLARHYYEARIHLTDRIERIIADRVMPLLGQADLPAPMYLATRFSKAAGCSYLALCCPFCNYIQGDIPLNHHSVTWRRYVVEGWLPLPIKRNVLGREHQCIDIGRGQCSQNPPEPEGPAFPDSELVTSGATSDLLTSELPPLPKRGVGRQGLRKPS
ncbi:competence protein CoiA family protein [Arthrobacter sp. OAP107]|uniref:competence protein CoiA n=1 Tax=Arthrobacter sp. OAP107 TaxID=3156445 RepID=UPI003398C4F3